ncbi:hypothetical protein BGX23_010882 [Mortierella sp. AD031]|nr:hypothetical protein BGX23_010882 [Mortierella sp. AD031]
MANVYRFGPHTISSGQVFLKTQHCLGLVNLKPILPRRNVPRFLDLSPDEVSDMFQTAQRVGKIIEKEYNATSLTIACQDGPAAGQTVPHCHVHVIPRRLGDFDHNDDIYEKITANTAELLTHPEKVVSLMANTVVGSKGVDNEDRRPRSEQEMAQEATWLQSLLAPDV